MPLEKRRERVAQAWNLTNEVVLVQAGDEIPVPGGQDQRYAFRPHTDYLYLTEDKTPNGVLAFDPHEGWTHFLPAITWEDQLWTGAEPREEANLDGLRWWLEQRADRPLAIVGGGGGESDLAAHLESHLLHARRPKDEAQLAKIRQAVKATAAGHAKLRSAMAEGMSERELQILMEAAFFLAGGNGLAYDSIVLAGARAAFLHGHPSQTRLQKGQVLLVDAGAEVDFYAADVTRTYCEGGFRGLGSDLFAMLLEVQQKAVNACRPGLEFSELHLWVCAQLATGLANLKLLKGTPEELVEQGAIDLFFPHGLGHMVGMGVRDGSGTLAGRQPFVTPGGTRVRLNLPMEKDYVVTIEPGLYFIKPLLTNPATREKFAHLANWSLIDTMLDFGGLRIEDNVRIQDGPPEILTSAIPHC